MSVKIDKKIKGYAVVKPEDVTKAPVQSGFVSDADRRLSIVNVPTPPTASLRWQKRPEFVEGNPGHMYRVKSPEGEFVVFVGHIANGSPTTGVPFEVWVNGEEAPRGLSDIARSLSIDMRSEDRAWLKRKLEALMKTSGTEFEMTMPDGAHIRANSAVDAFARLVYFRCEQLGAFAPEKLYKTPVIDALMSKREPKTTGSGGVAWYFDVHNQQTGDKFSVVLKEADIDGQKRPFSLWLSGNFPKSLEGLSKSLSLDMRVVDPAWVARKLKQLEDVKEDRGDFWAPVPGSEKQANYPSTIAYIAAAIQYRFKVLGLFNDEGAAAVESGVVQLHQVREDREAKAASHAGHPNGRDCPSCKGVKTVVRLDGCDTCTSCSASKCG